MAAGLGAIIAMGLYFSSSAGAFNAAPAALAGISAYASGLLSVKLGWPFVPTLVAGMLVTLGVGLLLALLTLRMNVLVGGLATLGFGETAVVIGYNLDQVGGALGLSGIPNRTQLWHVYVLLAIVVVAAWRFDSSRLGLAAQACRHSPTAAAAMGINVPVVKMTVFALGGAIIGLGGALQAQYLLVVTPDDLGLWHSFNYIIFWIFGGSYAFAGPAVGAVVLSVLPELLRFSASDRFIVYGTALVAMIILRPEGIITRRPLRDGTAQPRKTRMLWQRPGWKAR
jgi:branched-chain amino acid transport system permease protein